MTILIDYSHLSYRNASVLEDIKTGNIDKDLITHMILNSIRSLKVKYGNEYGGIVICCDGRYNWRRSYFDYYKQKRRDDRKKSKVDWVNVFAIFDSIKATLKEVFPYKVLELEGVEADDIIGVLGKNSKEKTLIIGGDKDFVQILKNPLVKIYSPNTKKFVEVENIEDIDKQLFELIVKGDVIDGIPNIKSDSDVFLVEGKRQQSISKKDLKEWFPYRDNPKKFCTTTDMMDKYKRNQILIDFDYIPDQLKEDILYCYENYQIRGNKTAILNYFMENKMRILLQHINDF